MKKLLSILGTLGLVSTLGTAVVSCQQETEKSEKDEKGESVEKKSIEKESITGITLEVVSGTMNNEVQEIVFKKMKEFNSEITKIDYLIAGLSSIANVQINKDSKIIVTASKHSTRIKDSFAVVVTEAPKVAKIQAEMENDLLEVHDKALIRIQKENFKQLVNVKYEVSGDNTFSVIYQRFEGVFELNAFTYGKTNFTITAENAPSLSFEFNIASPEILVKGLEENKIKIGNEINFEIENFKELGKITFSYDNRSLEIFQNINDLSKYHLKGKLVGKVVLTISAEKTDKFNEYPFEIIE